MAGESGALRELLAIFSFDVETEGLKKGEAGLESFKDKIVEVGEALLAAFAIEGIHRFVEGFVGDVRQVEHAALRLGLSTEKVQELKFTAQSLGIEFEGMVGALSRLQVAQGAAASGTGEQAKAFQQLGVHLKDANGHMKSADELLLDVADGISKIDDPAKQAFLTRALMGRSGPQFLPLLKEGRKGLEEFAAKFKELGGGFDEGTIERSKDFEKAQAGLSVTWMKMKETLGAVLIPVVTKVVEGLAKMFAALRKAMEGTAAAKVAIAGVVAFLVALSAPILVAAAPWLLLAASIAAVVAIVIELIDTFNGKDTYLRDYFDAIFGKGATTEAIAKIRDIWKDIVDTIKAGVAYVKELVGYTQQFNYKESKAAAEKAVAAVRARGGSLEEQSDAATKAFLTGGVPAEAKGLGPSTSEITRAAFGAVGVTPGGGGINIGGIHIDVPVGVNWDNPKIAGAVLGQSAGEALKQTLRETASTLPRGTPK